METLPVDIEPEQIVRWIMAEQHGKPPIFKTIARRTTEIREIPARSELHLGDEEREDLSEVATIATLEIAPIHASEGWLLTVTVEDEIGPRVLNQETAAETEQQLDLGTFYSAYIRPRRGTATVAAQVEDSAAAARLTMLLGQIERNRHGASGKDRKLPASREQS